LGSLGGARAGFTPSSAARTAGASSAQQQRSEQPIAFSDFCQIVDMQFLTHIRRGTSISVMDFQPSSVPQDLNQALQLLAITSESERKRQYGTCKLSLFKLPWRIVLADVCWCMLNC
jgi:hypothetical protein